MFQNVHNLVLKFTRLFDQKFKKYKKTNILRTRPTKTATTIHFPNLLYYKLSNN